ncbi:flavodoxin domain-containing protein [Paraglaciecola mesophila]|jgi:flavodoxin|uniref:Flavodoxin n=2 Tax=Paraglaciecola mesophila TaxID=197222 RepID=K6Z3R2_9ALTE|nr:flavodoxin domain-containing protein [Paraglaciecola mesophila]GAC25017.1 flavodoxin [Paraglaciecola mesophila KMM 241]|tara:strand:+ start:1232 stop:1678 length:447 start_codon:yes stop_codon:yes gene_type:complete
MSKVGIFVGSVYGNAQHVAEQVQELLTSKQVVSEIYDDPSIDDFKRCDGYIFVSSTTGQGDIPPNLEFFVADLKDMFPLMDQKPFAVIGLGDSSYCDSYCGAGEQIQALLLELQGKPVADMLKIDACETLEPEKEALAFIEPLAAEFA